MNTAHPYMDMPFFTAFAVFGGGFLVYLDDY